MGRFLSTNTGGSSVAITVCPRCSFKYHYADLKQDPNTKQYVCKDCCDLYDPWRMPARIPENISLTRPRPDEKLNTAEVAAVEDVIIGAGTNLPLVYDDDTEIGITE